MPNTSPKLPKSTTKSLRFSQLPSKRLSLPASIPFPLKSKSSSSSSSSVPPSPSLQSLLQFKSQSQNQKKNKKKKKKKPCYSSCCCIMFLGLMAFLFVFILQESWDPEGELAVKFMENDVLSEITGPNVELPGSRLAKQGLGAHFPVVFIPGIVSTGLEVWQGHPCAQKHFRQRFWGTGLMLRKILLAKQCWLQHIMLTQEWKDPPGVKLRPAQGLVAADYLVADYWVWARVIENLAYLGYDESNMHMASYDWRLPFRMLETRDRYFTRLKANIELLRITNNHTRVALIAHSMGSNVVLYFLRWVENNFGSLWVEKNVEVFVNIGGPLLGVSKTISSLLSGEMRDTAELNPTLQFIKENFLSKEDLMHVFRSFGSLPSMMPKGVWPGPILQIREDHIPLLRQAMAEKIGTKNTDADEAASTSETNAQSTNEKSKSETNSEDSTNTANSTNSTNSTVSEDLNGIPKTDSENNSTDNSTTEIKNDTQPQSPANNITPANISEDKSTPPVSTPTQKSAENKSEQENDKTDQSKTKEKESTSDKNSKKASDQEAAHKTPTKQKVDGELLEEIETVAEDEKDTNTPPKEPETTGSDRSSQEIRSDVKLPPYVNFTISQALELLREISPGYMDLLEEFYDLGFNGSRMDLHDERQWVNPLLTPLPQSSLRVYCMYGVGKPTEYSLPIEIDTSVNEDDVFHGVVVGDGDGTVPVMSLGYLCSKGWHSKELNPASVPIVTREYQHSVLSLLEGARAGFDGLRGGYGTADHVDIMGNHHMLEDISKILSNQLVDEVQNQYYSNIVQMANEVEFDSEKTVK